MTLRYVAAGLMLVAVLAGVVVAYLADVSPVVRTITVGSTPVSLAVDAQTGRAFVVNNGDNSVGVIDTHRAVLVRTVAVGTGPTAAVVDEPDRRVFVTTAETSVSQQTAQIAFLSYIGGFRDTGGGYMASDSRSLSVLDASSGQLVQAVAAGVSPLGVVVDTRRGRVFATTTQYGLLGSGSGSVLTVRGGRVYPFAAVPGMPLALAVDGRANRAIVVGDSEGGTVSVLDATSGRLIQRTVIGTVLIGHSLAVDEATVRAFAITTNLSANRGSVGVFDTRSGRLLRTISLPSAPTAIAVDGRTGHVFVSTMGPAIVISSWPGFGRLSVSVPVSTGNGRVIMLDARSGAVVRSTSVGIGPGAMAVDARQHHLLVVNAGAMDSMGTPLGPGTLSVLDTRSGAVLRTVTVGLAPGDIAVDERAGRALVLDMGGTVHVTDAWGWLPPWLRQRLPFLPQHAPGTRTVSGSVTVLDTARL